MAHLRRILSDHLPAQGIVLPALNVVSPSGSSRDSLDYVNISLLGTLWEDLHPDVLQRIRSTINENVPGVEANWKIGSGFDKSQQITFHVEDSSHLAPLKEKLERIFQLKGFLVQACWVPKEGTQITSISLIPP
jgi:hypothetical protein